MRQVSQENYRGIEDELSSFEQVEVQKKSVTERKIEVVENPRFVMKARQKELEQRQRQREESTSMVKEEKNFSLFPHHHHRSESQAAAAIQEIAVEQEQQVQGVSATPRSKGSFERVVDR
jgi:hypothetical protein